MWYLLRVLPPFRKNLFAFGLKLFIGVKGILITPIIPIIRVNPINPINRIIRVIRIIPVIRVIYYW